MSHEGYEGSATPFDCAQAANPLVGSAILRYSQSKMSNPARPVFTYEVTVTVSVIVRLVACSLVLLWVAFELFDVVTEWTSPSMNVSTLTASALVSVATIVLHEWVHGISMAASESHIP